MKHVFITPNPVSYFVAHAVVDKCNLNPTDTLIVYTRNFRPRTDEVQTERLPFSYNDFPYTRRLWKVWSTVYHFDRWVDKKVGTPFSLYLPHGGMPQYQLLRTHALCREVNYIEEGTIAYLNQEELDSLLRRSIQTRDSTIRTFGYFNRWQRGADRFPDRNAIVYGCFPETFPWSSNKVLVRYRVEPQHPGTCTDVEAVLALRPNLDRYWTKALLVECIQRFASWANCRRIGSIALKLHPGGTGNSDLVSVTKAILSSYGLLGVVLPQSFYLEEYLLSSGSLVVTMGSSVDFYSVELPGRLMFLGAFAARPERVLKEYVCEQPTAVRSFYSGIAETSRRAAEMANCEMPDS